jgi:hypothetical protein
MSSHLHYINLKMEAVCSSVMTESSTISTVRTQNTATVWTVHLYDTIYFTGPYSSTTQWSHMGVEYRSTHSSWYWTDKSGCLLATAPAPHVPQEHEVGRISDTAWILWTPKNFFPPARIWTTVSWSCCLQVSCYNDWPGPAPFQSVVIQRTAQPFIYSK